MLRRTWYGLSSAGLASVILVAVGGTSASANSDVAFTGEVTGNDVYVRSGPSTNYYPVTKLNAGARVSVVDVVEGWYAIVPPEGCFSLIHKKFVDIGDKPSAGVVNGNAVRVRAGSSLRPDLYAKQLKLNRGAEVTVLGPHNDDYLRIAPPEGVRLYISQEFVARDTGSTAKLRNEPVPTPPSTSDTPDAKPVDDASDDKAADTAKAGEERESAKSESSYRGEIEELDAALAAEMREPLLHRDYSSLIARYGVLAEQDDDEYARVYAKSRIIQLHEASDGLSAVRELRDLGTKLKRERTIKLIERQQWRMRERKIGGAYDAIGELRPSMIWTAPTGPKRYRLVGDEKPTPRTIAYVEIPAQSNLDIRQFLGRRVGVRAGTTRLETQDVDPIVIYVASELVVLGGE